MYDEVAELEFFGDDTDRESLAELTDFCIGYGFSQLSLRRSLHQVMFFDRGPSPTLVDIRDQMCMQYFHFHMPELIIMARELRWYGRSFKVVTGRKRQNN